MKYNGVQNVNNIDLQKLQNNYRIQNELRDFYVLTSIFNPASYKSRTDLYY